MIICFILDNNPTCIAIGTQGNILSWGYSTTQYLLYAIGMHILVLAARVWFPLAPSRSLCGDGECRRLVPGVTKHCSHASVRTKSRFHPDTLTHRQGCTWSVSGGEQGTLLSSRLRGDRYLLRADVLVETCHTLFSLEVPFSM